MTNTDEAVDADITTVRPEDLTVEFLDAHRIYYNNSGPGPAIEGSPFSVEFHDNIDPEEFIEDVFSAEPPYYTIGFHTPIGEGYYSVSAVAHETPSIEAVCPFNVEVNEEWMRVYIENDDGETNRLFEFFKQLAEDYRIEFRSARPDLPDM